MIGYDATVRLLAQRGIVPTAADIVKIKRELHARFDPELLVAAFRVAAAILAGDDAGPARQAYRARLAEWEYHTSRAVVNALWPINRN